MPKKEKIRIKFLTTTQNQKKELHCFKNEYWQHKQQSASVKRYFNGAGALQLKNGTLTQIYSFSYIFSYGCSEICEDNIMESVNKFSKICFLDSESIELNAFVFKGDDEISDEVGIDFISSYYRQHHLYRFVCDFDIPLYEASLSFTEEELIELIKDYNNLCSLNKDYREFEHDELIKIISNIKLQILPPALSGAEIYAGHDSPAIIYFITIKNITEIPFLLLIAIHKKLMNYDSIETSFEYLMSMSLLWQDDNNTNLTLYKYCGSLEASELSGFSIEDFDPEEIAYK